MYDSFLANSPLENRVIECKDAACSCERMICECDAAFARANEIAHRKMDLASYDSSFNYYKYRAANDGENLRISDLCDGSVSPPGEILFIHDFIFHL